MHTTNQAKLIVKYEIIHYCILDVDVNIESNVCEIQKVVIFHLLQAMDEWWQWWGGGAFANFTFGLKEHSEFSCALRTHVRSRTINVAAIENTPSLNAAENIKTNVYKYYKVFR